MCHCTHMSFKNISYIFCPIRFNTVGDQQDMRWILHKVKNKYPGRKIYGVGISAGTSLLARYLGGMYLYLLKLYEHESLVSLVTKGWEGPLRLCPSLQNFDL